MLVGKHALVLLFDFLDDCEASNADGAVEISDALRQVHLVVSGGETVCSFACGIDSLSVYDSSCRKESTVPQTAFINSQIESVWADAGVEPVERATDLEWCRRVYLDLIGRIPTVDEVLRYKNDHSRDKQSVLVDRLLGDEYVREYAKHWSNVWTTVLIGRDADNRMIDRSGMAEVFTNSMGIKRSIRSIR